MPQDAEAPQETIRVTISSNIYNSQFTDHEVRIRPTVSTYRLLKTVLREKDVKDQLLVAYRLQDASGILLPRTASLTSNNIKDGDRLYLCVLEKDTKEDKGTSEIVLTVLSLAFFLACLCLASVLFTSPTTGGLPWPGFVPMTLYGLVFDAGSVHTTLTVYSWPQQKLNGTGVVREAFSCEANAKVGISSLKLEEVHDYIMNSSCYKQAMAIIPDESRNQTRIFLGSTAGMRVLNATDPKSASALNERISAVLRRTPLNHSATVSEILQGSDEGILGWITSNYLNNVFRTDKSRSSPSAPLGALDWGGASSQITFVVDPGQQVVEADTVRSISLYGKNYTLFTASHLCYGQSEALTRYFVQLVHDAYLKGRKTLPKELSFLAPCQPESGSNGVTMILAKDLFYSPCTIYKDAEFQKAVESLDKNETLTFKGTANEFKCVRMIERNFDPELCKTTYKQPHCFNRESIPKPPRGTKFLAFSTYWYVYSTLKESLSKNLVGQAPNETGLLKSRQQFHKTTSGFCSKSYQDINSKLHIEDGEVVRNTCFKGLFMRHLLTKGYHFNEWDDIEIVNRVNDAEVGWTLGWMIKASEDLPSFFPFHFGSEVTVALVYLLVLAAFFLVWFICLVFFECIEAKQKSTFERFVHSARGQRNV